MKKNALLTMLIALMLLIGIGSVQAEIIPPRGEGQIGLQAVVLCESLTLRREPSAAADTVDTLKSGDLPIVTEQSGEWAYCFLGDSEDSPSGWVNADFIIIDPAWVRLEEKTPVYAWADTTAPKVALLDRDTTLPILKEEGEWLVVGLRGASGWIRKTAAD